MLSSKNNNVLVGRFHPTVKTVGFPTPIIKQWVKLLNAAIREATSLSTPIPLKNPGRNLTKEERQLKRDLINPPARGEEAEE
jgi:hypothetical protein